MPKKTELLNDYADGLCRFEHLTLADKDFITNATMRYMFARTNNMFVYAGLPDTLPAHYFELYLQKYGGVIITTATDANTKEQGLFAFRPALSGVRDMYYRPTQAIVTNPAMDGGSKNVVLGEDAVLIKNDTTFTGLTPMFLKYASLLTENEITLRMADIYLRQPDVFTAPDSNAKKQVEGFYRDLEEGKFGAVVDENFLERLAVNPHANTGTNSIINACIELEQYLKASFFNEIGLNANYNMKREAINTSEAQMNNDALFPLVEDMLKCRKEGVEKVNALFGTKITVELGGIWAEKAEEEYTETEDEEKGDEKNEEE